MLREAAAAVVIGAGTPERRSRGTPEPLLAVLAQGDRPLLRDGEQQLKAAAFTPMFPSPQITIKGNGGAYPGGAQGGGTAGNLHFVAGILGIAAGRGVVPVAYLLHSRLFGAIARQCRCR